MDADPFSPEFWKTYQKRFQTEKDELFLKPDFWDQMAEGYDDLEATPFFFTAFTYNLFRLWYTS